MNISFENPDKVNGFMTIVVEEADYKNKVEKTLKDYRKKANVPGFRPGMVPMNMVKKQYGTAVKMEEINKLLSEELFKYLRENNIPMLGEPLASDKQEPQDLEGDGPFTFMFDIAVAPEINLELTNKDKIDFYEIKVDDKLIDQQIDELRGRAGHHETVEAYDAEQRDMLKGELVELDSKGKAKEDGIKVEEAIIMPDYIKVAAQKKLFDGAKLGDTIKINPKKAYPDNDAEIAALLKMKKEEVADLKSNFNFTIKEISRYVKAEINKELFDQVFGEGKVETEEQFRSKIAEGLQAQFAGHSDYRFIVDLRAFAEKKAGEITLPEELLKRVMKNNNKDKGEEYVEKNFEGSLRELKWHLIKEQLSKQLEVKIEEADVMEAAKGMARAQFAQYGMNNIPEEYIDNYAKDMLKKKEQADRFIDRAVEQKIIAGVKGIVKLNKKEVSLEEFNKLFEA
ncbi:MAG: trigger factor [Prevotella sp.]|nr:trigger factor [Prevotella sp.]